MFNYLSQPSAKTSVGLIKARFGFEFLLVNSRRRAHIASGIEGKC